MTFSEARRFFEEGKKIRHDSMPDGHYIMLYRRGWGTDIPLILDGNDNISGEKVLFHEMFWSALQDYDEWEVTE